MVLVRAPAKLNLGLVLVDRRPDGYHSIETLFVPLRLFDELQLQPSAGANGTTLDCDDPALSQQPDNLALRGARAAAAALGYRGGIEMQLKKRIPVAAGLGGGSSDAAAAILGVEALAGRELECASRRALALQIGADVPFFLDPGPARASGIGEQLAPLADLPELWWVLVALPFSVSTAWAYREASRELTLPRDPSSIAALLEPTGVVSSPHNDLDPHNDLETVTARKHPEVGQARRALASAGARITGMSGSGPTVYGQFGEREAAERAVAGARLPAGARALVASSPESGFSDWGWGVAKW